MGMKPRKPPVRSAASSPDDQLVGLLELIRARALEFRNETINQLRDVGVYVDNPPDVQIVLSSVSGVGSIRWENWKFRSSRKATR